MGLTENPPERKKPQRTPVRAFDLGLLIGLGTLAFALRLPNYQSIPVFTDEVDEAYRSLLVARGQLLPLTNVDAYNGALWNYLVAAGYWVSGFSIYAARIIALACGVLTILAGYGLGRAWGGRPGGLITGLLMSTAASHIVVNSHIGWGNSITPLFTTLALWATWRSASSAETLVSRGPLFERPESRHWRRSGLWLLLAGLCWGLALQTHPTVLGLLPGAAIFLLWKAPRLFRTGWPCAAVCLFLLVNLNLLIYNLTTGFGSLSDGLTVASNYSRSQALSVEVYVARFSSFLLGLLRLSGGGVNQRLEGMVDQITLDPGLWPIALLALAALVWQCWRGNPLPSLLLVGLALLLPLFDGRYDRVQHSRYLAPLLPLLFGGVGALLSSAFARQSGLVSGSSRATALSLVLLVAFLVVHPLSYLWTYYDQETRFGRTNAPLQPTLALLRAQNDPDGPVILDDSAQQGSVGLGGGWRSRILRLALSLEGIPFELVDLDEDVPLLPQERCHDRLVVLGIRRTESRQDVVIRLGLSRLAPVDLGSSTGNGYPVYRLARQTPGFGGC